LAADLERGVSAPVSAITPVTVSQASLEEATFQRPALALNIETAEIFYLREAPNRGYFPPALAG
jgi:hypothetical protein